MLEPGTGHEFKIGESLPPVAITLLRKLGLAASVERGSHLRSYGSLSVWGSAQLKETDFLQHPEGHGWHLDRGAFDSLVRDVATHAGADLRMSARPREVHRTADGWVIHYQEPGVANTAVCRFVVDATGLARWFARHIDISSVSYDRLIAMAAIFQGGEHSLDKDSRSLVEAGPDGWWYTSRLPRGRRLVAYFTDGDEPSLRELRTSEGFLQHLDATGHVRERVLGHGYVLEQPPRGWPAYSTRLSAVAGDTWLAAGDSAGTYDPLSSQGIMTAVRTGDEAARALARALGGEHAAMAGYASLFEQRYAEYLARRSQYYAAEQRWGRRPFWRRRHASP